MLGLVTFFFTTSILNSINSELNQHKADMFCSALKSCSNEHLCSAVSKTFTKMINCDIQFRQNDNKEKNIQILKLNALFLCFNIKAKSGFRVYWRRGEEKKLTTFFLLFAACEFEAREVAAVVVERGSSLRKSIGAQKDLRLSRLCVLLTDA